MANCSPAVRFHIISLESFSRSMMKRDRPWLSAELFCNETTTAHDRFLSYIVARLANPIAPKTKLPAAPAVCE
jgi:hypothetical protein